MRLCGHPEGDCDCDGNQLTPLESVAVRLKTLMPMASATTWMTAWARLTLVASATAQEEIYECGG